MIMKVKKIWIAEHPEDSNIKEVSFEHPYSEMHNFFGTTGVPVAAKWKEYVIMEIEDE